MKKILFLFVLIFVSIFSMSVKATNITGCSNLTTAGDTYYLTSDIINDGNVTCINITANNVTLDCQGHTIDGKDTAGTTGISASRWVSFGFETFANITVKNCIVSDWFQGLSIWWSNNITLMNITSKSSYDALITGDNDYGVYTNLTLKDSYYGWNMDSDMGFIFNDSMIENNSEIFEMVWDGSTTTLQSYMYNNIFNGTYGVLGWEVPPHAVPILNFSTTKTLGTRIYSNGTNMGGNYWTNSTGNGYSDTCIDEDKDGFCDIALNVSFLDISQCSGACLSASNTTDFLPLSNKYSSSSSTSPQIWYNSTDGLWRVNCTIPSGMTGTNSIYLKANETGTYNITRDTISADSITYGVSTYSRMIVEYISMPDIFTRIGTMLRSMTGIVLLNDINVIYSTRIKSAFDVISVSDAITRILTSLRQNIDILLFYDINGRTSTLTRSFADIITLNDVSSKAINSIRYLTDMILFKDASSRTANLLVPFTDIIKIIDAATGNPTRPISSADILTITGVSSKTISALRSFSDMIIFNDVGGRIGTTYYNFAELLKITDATTLLSTRGKFMSDSINIIDMTGRITSLTIKFTDIILLNDVSSVFPTRVTSISDMFKIYDASSRGISVFRSFSDNLLLQDSSSRFSLLSAFITDVFGICPGGSGTVSSTTTYNFSDTTNNQAWETTTTSAILYPNSSWSLYSSAQYGNITNPDADNNTFTITGTSYINNLYNFTINQSVNSITTLNATWVGEFGKTGTCNYIGVGNFSVYNYTSQDWTLKQVVTGNSGSQNNRTVNWYYINVTSGFSDLINNSKLYLYARSGTVVAPGSFIEGTKIRTPSGDINIEDLKVGDSVYGVVNRINIVTDIKKTQTNELINITTTIGEISGTPTHPVYLSDGFNTKMMKDLVTGDVISSFYGYATVISSQTLSVSNITVYDIGTIPDATFFANNIKVDDFCAGGLSFGDDYVELDITSSTTGSSDSCAPSVMSTYLRTATDNSLMKDVIKKTLDISKSVTDIISLIETNFITTVTGTNNLINIADRMFLTDLLTKIGVFPKSLTDNVLILDITVRVPTRYGNLLDTLLLRDLSGRSTLLNLPITDIIKLIDTQSKSITGLRSSADNLLLSDSNSRLSSLLISFKDSINIFDTSSMVPIRFGYISNVLLLRDTNINSLSIVRYPTDLMKLLDNTFMSPQRFANLVDMITFKDASKYSLNIVRYMADIIRFIDVKIISTTASITYPYELVNNIVFVDMNTRVVQLSQKFVGLINIIDVNQRQSSLSIPKVDILTINGVLGKFTSVFKSSNETINIFDLNSRMTEISRMSNGNIMIIDTTNKLYDGIRQMADIVSIFDVSGRSGKILYNLADSILINDLNLKSANIQRMFDGKLLISDASERVSMSMKQISDIVLLFDTSGRIGVTAHYLSEDMMVNDMSLRVVGMNRMFADKILLRDSLDNVFRQNVQNFAGSFTITEINARYTTIYRSFDDTIYLLSDFLRFRWFLQKDCSIYDISNDCSRHGCVWCGGSCQNTVCGVGAGGTGGGIASPLTIGCPFPPTPNPSNTTYDCFWNTTDCRYVCGNKIMNTPFIYVYSFMKMMPYPFDNVQVLQCLFIILVLVIVFIFDDERRDKVKNYMVRNGYIPDRERKYYTAPNGDKLSKNKNINSFKADIGNTAFNIKRKIPKILPKKKNKFKVSYV
jgi:hypothetical protein